MKNNGTIEQEFFLSRLIGSKVLIKDKKIGKLDDIIIQETGKIPEVTHVVVSRPFGHSSLYIPLEKVQSIDKKEIVLDIDSPGEYVRAPQEAHILLKGYVLDKKVLDLDDHEVEVVYDVRLLLRAGKLYASDVDISKYALLKRLGLKPLAKFIHNLANKINKETIPWTYVQSLPENISGFKGNLKLNILRENLSDIHPVDLADILEELNHEQRVALFSELETEHASDTLEEIEPPVQRILISSIPKERTAELIDDMTPAQAADVLAVLPAADAEDILELMDKEDAEQIEDLLEKHNEHIGNLATSEFIKLQPTANVGYVMDNFRAIAKDKDEVMYIYVVDDRDKLIGVADLKELLQAGQDQKLEDIMVTHVISLKPDNTLQDAAEMFSRYSFRSIPIAGEDEIILGVVPYRDVMKLKHRMA
jgi:CBS domain-containing protein/uncharacterized protein YrrD